MAIQKLTFIRGIPGSGKTTMAKKMNATLVEADMYFTDKDGNYHYNSRFVKDAHQWCQLEMKRILLAGEDVVVANTFIKKWELTNYLKLVQHLGLKLDIKVIEAEGRFQNAHGVADEMVERMHQQYQRFVLKPMQDSQNGGAI